MALNKLRGELKAAGVKQYEAASLLGMTANNFNRKLAEAVPFTRDEMFKLQSAYFPNLTLEHLFQSDGNVPTDGELADERERHVRMREFADELQLEPSREAVRDIADEGIHGLDYELNRRSDTRKRKALDAYDSGVTAS